ncbi:hypothetical protein F5B21DRAFT_154554 [Xylaria acuta]|nr:hypothetical protein F5B21DRAFT_154554 [Xylaria acuta]
MPTFSDDGVPVGQTTRSVNIATGLLPTTIVSGYPLTTKSPSQSYPEVYSRSIDHPNMYWLKRSREHSLSSSIVQMPDAPFQSYYLVNELVKIIEPSGETHGSIGAIIHTEVLSPEKLASDRDELLRILTDEGDKATVLLPRTPATDYHFSPILLGCAYKSAPDPELVYSNLLHHAQCLGTINGILPYKSFISTYGCEELYCWMRRCMGKEIFDLMTSSNPNNPAILLELSEDVNYLTLG